MQETPKKQLKRDSFPGIGKVFEALNLKDKEID